MHKVAPEVANAVDVPLIHIGDVTADALCASGARTVGLLGTRFTMEQRFYVDRLGARGIECLVPDAPGREAVHRIIFEELCQGRIEADSRRALQRECTALAQAGAEAIVLGCTELTLLLGPGDLPLPVFDTTELHALAGAAFVLEGVQAATMAA
jgi:aspartate racemase